MLRVGLRLRVVIEISESISRGVDKKDDECEVAVVGGEVIGDEIGEADADELFNIKSSGRDMEVMLLE